MQAGKARMKTNGVNCQISVTQIAKKARPGSASHAGFSPNTDSQPLIGPTLTSNMYRHINPTQIGAIIIGSTSSVRKDNHPPKRLFQHQRKADAKDHFNEDDDSRELQRHGHRF